MAAALIGIGANLLGGVGGGLFSIFHGNKQYKKGLDIFENTPFPEYSEPQEVAANQAIAARMAMTGLPSSQYQRALNNINRSQTFGLNALQTRGGSIGDVNALVGQGNDAALALDTADAEARRQALGTLMQSNLTAAQYKDKAYQINKLQRYLMRLGMASSLMQGGNANLNQGLNTLGTGLAGAAFGFQDVANTGGFKNLFSNKMKNKQDNFVNGLDVNGLTSLALGIKF